MMGESDRRMCAGCASSLPLSAFSKTQLRKKAAQRRCLRCVGGEEAASSAEVSSVEVFPQHEKEVCAVAPWLRGSDLLALPSGERMTWSWRLEKECPICSEEMPRDHADRQTSLCCGKTICRRCQLTAGENDECGVLVVEEGQTTLYQNAKDRGRTLASRCFFCREPIPEKDEVEARLIAAARRGDAFGLYVLGRRRVEEGRSDEGWKLVKKAAAMGYPTALNFLGNHYLNGPRRVVDATDCWRAAALRGDSGALFNLGQALLLGAPLDYQPPYPPPEQWRFLQDPDAALELFRAAAAVPSIARACEVLQDLSLAPAVPKTKESEEDAGTCAVHLFDSAPGANNGDLRCPACGKATTCERCVTVGAYRCRSCRALLWRECPSCGRRTRVDRFAYLDVCRHLYACRACCANRKDSGTCPSCKATKARSRLCFVDDPARAPPPSSGASAPAVDTRWRSFLKQPMGLGLASLATFWSPKLVGRHFFDHHSPTVEADTPLKVATVFFMLIPNRFFQGFPCAEVAPVGTDDMDDDTLKRACKLVNLADVLTFAAPDLTAKHRRQYADAHIARQHILYLLSSSVAAARKLL